MCGREIQHESTDIALTTQVRCYFFEHLQCVRICFLFGPPPLIHRESGEFGISRAWATVKTQGSRRHASLDSDSRRPPMVMTTDVFIRVYYYRSPNRRQGWQVLNPPQGSASWQ